jgi:hypothetical protein
MAVDCRIVNLKICFGSNLQPTIEHTFQQYSGTFVFLVLDPNSAYFQNSLTPWGQRVTAFYTPCGRINLTSFRWGSAWVVKVSVGYSTIRWPT